jgi:hypothetical protein
VHQMQSSHISELMAVTAISAMLSSMFIPWKALFHNWHTSFNMVHLPTVQLDVSRYVHWDSLHEDGTLSIVPWRRVCECVGYDIVCTQNVYLYQTCVYSVLWIPARMLCLDDLKVEFLNKLQRQALVTSTPNPQTMAHGHAGAVGVANNYPQMAIWPVWYILRHSLECQSALIVWWQTYLSYLFISVRLQPTVLWHVIIF